MPERLSISALLSQALVAFTIEFDNEAERRMPHWTTLGGGTRRDGPWLVSMAMYRNCMRFVGEEAITKGRLAELARTPTNLRGMLRWGYITIKQPEARGDETWLRATRHGLQAREIWQPLAGEIEQRWRARFGAGAIDRLQEALNRIEGQFLVHLPDCLPILGYGLWSRVARFERTAADADAPDLPALLARVLLAFAASFERKSAVSLAIAANVLRVLDNMRNNDGVRVRDFPALAGVSKESISMALGFLENKQLITVVTGPQGGRWKIAQLTPEGIAALEAYQRVVEVVEARWRERFGVDAVEQLRAALEALTPKLFEGLTPYPENWRASISPPRALPYFPMVLHRGGYPDGS